MPLGPGILGVPSAGATRAQLRAPDPSRGTTGASGLKAPLVPDRQWPWQGKCTFLLQLICVEGSPPLPPFLPPPPLKKKKLTNKTTNTT